MSLPLLLAELDFLNSYYASLVDLVRGSASLCLQPNICLLFGIRRVEGPGFEHLTDHYMVRSTSYLGQASVRMPSSAHIQEHRPDNQLNSLILPSRELDDLLRVSIGAHIYQALSQLHSQLQNLSVLKLCLDMAVRHSCFRMNCDRDHDAHTLPEYPNLLVRAHLTIIQMMDGLVWISNAHNERHNERREVQRIWLNRLARAIQPLTPRLELPTIPGGHELRSVPQSWIREMIFALRPQGLSPRARQMFLSDALGLIFMAELFTEWEIPSYLHTATVLFARRPDLVRRHGDVSVVTDIIVSIARGDGGGDLRIRQGILGFRSVLNLLERRCTDRYGL